MNKSFDAHDTERVDPGPGIPQEGSVIKTAENPVVYFIKDGSRYGVPTEERLAEYGHNLSELKIIAPDIMNSIPDAGILPPAPVPDGSVVKTASGPVVYLIGTGRRYGVPTEERLAEYGHSLAELKVITDEQLNSIPDAGILPPAPLPDGAVVKTASGPVVYLIGTGRRYGVPTEERLAEYGHTLAELKVVSEDQLSAVPDGGILPPLSAEPEPGPEPEMEDEGPASPEEPDRDESDDPGDDEDELVSAQIDPGPVDDDVDTTKPGLVDKITPVQVASIKPFGGHANIDAGQGENSIPTEPGLYKRCRPKTLPEDFISKARDADAALRFDVVWCQPPQVDRKGRFMVFGAPQFAALNSGSKHFLAMPQGVRADIVEGAGNVVAAYYNELNEGWPELKKSKDPSTVRPTRGARAQAMHMIGKLRPDFAGFNTRSGLPKWLVLNEISWGRWRWRVRNYRRWVIEVVKILNQEYDHKVVILSPLSQAGGRADLLDDWWELSQLAYIGIEGYLDPYNVLGEARKRVPGGQLDHQDILGKKHDPVAYCTQQYKKFKDAYTKKSPSGHRVDADKLLLVEHFAHTTEAKRWGRSGLSKGKWEQVLVARMKGARAVKFAGLVSYAWMYNQMVVSQEEMVHFEQLYMDQDIS